MKNLITLTSLVALLCGSAQGQTFNSGSTGADGAFATPVGNFAQLPPGTQIQGTCDTGPCTVIVPLREPPNHVFNFTTVTINAGATIKFTPNKSNTPVFILAQGDVIINGTIDVSGEDSVGSSIIAAKGGPGGFSGGIANTSGATTAISGAGNGPGGGIGISLQNIPFFTTGVPGNFARGRLPYGTPELQPLIGGSGGGSVGIFAQRQNGGGGGGALLIASSGVLDLGSGSGVAINANGGGLSNSTSIFTAGSGGALRLVASVLRGSRIISAEGAKGGGCVGGDCEGRIRIEAAQAMQYDTSKATPTATFNLPGQPIVVFPPITPTPRILSIGGVPLPAQPTAEANTPDIALPANFTTPVPIELEATNVPSGTLAKVLVGPQYGAGDRIITPPVALTGPVGQPKRATVQVNLPPSGVGIISAVIDSVVPEP